MQVKSLDIEIALLRQLRSEHICGYLGTTKATVPGGEMKAQHRSALSCMHSPAWPVQRLRPRMKGVQGLAERLRYGIAQLEPCLSNSCNIEVNWLTLALT